MIFVSIASEMMRATLQVQFALGPASFADRCQQVSEAVNFVWQGRMPGRVVEWRAIKLRVPNRSL